MKILLKNTIDTLKQLKMEMHDVMDSSTQAKLDQVIQDLEQHNDLTKSKLTISPVPTLYCIIGTFIEKRNTSLLYFENTPSA